ncbi:UDP-N-acetyl-D-mannosaminuronic acid dehydrogenase [Methanocaldococcus bathoardescens]|uniref:UDP-N-acetyl-D-mannosamine dehydrogenase n=1 Tax=Methanocaldococcus bathoardescens TaxID=1301915 RepID=A0A076LH24_9EURY|nr:nucleotide sugar dehydrogenase [Methanocaldococcus bathoardescens]AIJ06182.1 UDP-N-acetyl-D-mannosaminuronic acid dehydrogenase [Methanocaldococcus bathoardescens]
MIKVEKNGNGKRICVIGLGYIGLPTASMLAIHGFDVIGVDINEKRVKEIKELNFKTTEKDLMTLVKGAINSGNLKVQTKPDKADVFIICVPTPCVENKGEKKCDLSYLNKAIENIKPYLENGNLIIIESTIPPGTTDEIYKKLSKDKKIYLAHCPERVLPGNILKELVENDRVIGGVDEKSAEMAKEIYETFVTGKIYLTDAKTAEMVKLMENTYRDVNIALANEFAKICEEIGINVWEAIELANKHPRVNILKPGPGVGGHCISIDPWFIVEKSKNAKLIKTARELNDSMPLFVVEKIKNIIKKDNGKVAIFGVTYKGNVDDTRESPAEKVVGKLIDEGFEVKCYDKYARDFIFPLCSLDEAVDGADIIVVLAEHDEYKNFNEEGIKNIALKVKNKLILDTKNIINRELWEKGGFKVYVLGDGKNV